MSGSQSVQRRILEPGPVAGKAPNMMVYPDPQWNCNATAPMLQLYDDVGYRGEFDDGPGDDHKDRTQLNVRLVGVTSIQHVHVCVSCMFAICNSGRRERGADRCGISHDIARQQKVVYAA